MAQFTKKAILDSFVRLLERTPFDKITVKKIVDDCEINRNTFYYYFNDIYDLLDEWLITETKAIFSKNDDSTNKSITCFKVMSLTNMRVMYNLYNSETRDRLELYLDKIIGYSMRDYVSNKADGIDVSSEDIDLIADFSKNAVVGMILGRLRIKSSTIIDEEFEKVEEMIDFFTENALEQKRKK